MDIEKREQQLIDMDFKYNEMLGTFINDNIYVTEWERLTIIMSNWDIGTLSEEKWDGFITASKLRLEK
jgi:hypothetical protein